VCVDRGVEARSIWTTLGNRGDASDDSMRWSRRFGEILVVFDEECVGFVIEPA